MAGVQDPMKYYKHSNTGKVFAFNDDGSQDHLISDYMIPMNEEEIGSHIARSKADAIESVSRLQALAALYQANLLESVELIVSESDKLTQLAWENAQEFRRDSPILKSLASSLDLTDGELDSLFKTASQIVA